MEIRDRLSISGTVIRARRVFHAVRSRLAALYAKVRWILYWGTRHTCPCCRGSFRRLVRYGQTASMSCPRCGAFDRHRLLWLYFQEAKLLSDGIRLLHFAPEAVLEKLLREGRDVRYVTADRFMAGVNAKMDLTALAFHDDSFDSILCVHVLEHVIDDRRAMRELCRILKPGGWAILQVPMDVAKEQTFEDFSITSPKDRERLFGEWDHVRIYGLDYAARLREAGFTVEVDPFPKRLGDERIRRYGLLRDENVYFCTKIAPIEATPRRTAQDEMPTT